MEQVVLRAQVEFLQRAAHRLQEGLAYQPVRVEFPHVLPSALEAWEQEQCL